MSVKLLRIKKIICIVINALSIFEESLKETIMGDGV
jgi:hypothetical protein